MAIDAQTAQRDEHTFNEALKAIQAAIDTSRPRVTGGDRFSAWTWVVPAAGALTYAAERENWERGTKTPLEHTIAALRLKWRDTDALTGERQRDQRHQVARAALSAVNQAHELPYTGPRPPWVDVEFQRFQRSPNAPPTPLQPRTFQQEAAETAASYVDAASEAARKAADAARKAAEDLYTAVMAGIAISSGVVAILIFRDVSRSRRSSSF